MENRKYSGFNWKSINEYVHFVELDRKANNKCIFNSKNNNISIQEVKSNLIIGCSSLRAAETLVTMYLTAYNLNLKPEYGYN